MIREAQIDELNALRDIEIAIDAPLTIQELAVYQADGRVWVSTDESDQLVVYILLQRVDNCAHLKQVSVHPDHAGRRLGQALIEFAVSWARNYDLAGVADDFPPCPLERSLLTGV